MNTTNQPGQAPTNDTLPQEVRNAITEAIFAHENSNSIYIPQALKLDNALCAALAPLWVRDEQEGKRNERRATCDALRAILSKRSEGEPWTWGFVAAFMQMIDEIEKGGAE